MRLQKQLSRKVGTKEYPKWVVTIPPNEINNIGWGEGEELEVQIKGDKLILKSKKKSI